MALPPTQRIFLLGVPIDVLTPDVAVVRIIKLLENGGRFHVMTPNSEMLVEAARNEAFHKVLNSSALNLPDSIGLLHMAHLTHQRLPHRVTGVDMVTRLCEFIGEEQSVFLLGGAPDIAERAAHKLQKKNSNLRIVGTYAGNPIPEETPDIINRINQSGARLLLVAYGAPAQDLWISENFSKFTSVRIAMGVGGTFDFISGRIRRAPKLFRLIGLEWMWRVLREPRRIKRILNATVVFPLLIFRYGKRSPH